MSKITIIFLVVLTCAFFVYGQQQKNPSKPIFSRTVPMEAFGTFEGTQKSYVFYAGGYGISVPQSDWKLTIKKNKIELFNYANNDVYLYTGNYKVKKVDSSSGCTLNCNLKILKDGTVDKYETTLRFLKNDEGQYFWVKISDTEGEPEVILNRVQE